MTTIIRIDSRPRFFFLCEFTPRWLWYWRRYERRTNPDPGKTFVVALGFLLCALVLPDHAL